MLQGRPGPPVPVVIHGRFEAEKHRCVRRNSVLGLVWRRVMYHWSSLNDGARERQAAEHKEQLGLYFFKTTTTRTTI